MLIYRVETSEGAGPWVDGNKEPGDDWRFGSGAGTAWCLAALSASWRVGQFNEETRNAGSKPRYGFSSLDQLFQYAVPHSDTHVTDHTVVQLLESMRLMQVQNLLISIYEIPRYEYDAMCADHTQVVFKLSAASLLKRINPVGAYMTQRIHDYQRQSNDLMAA